MRAHDAVPIMPMIFLLSLGACASSGDLDALRQEVRSSLGATKRDVRQVQARVDAVAESKADIGTTRQLETAVRTLEKKWDLMSDDLGREVVAMRKALEQANSMQDAQKEIDDLSRKEVELGRSLHQLQSLVATSTSQVQALARALVRAHHAQIETLQSQAKELEQTARALDVTVDKKH
ncbi:hypothetical protein [Candidatus Nitrospira bockiana]